MNASLEPLTYSDSRRAQREWASLSVSERVVRLQPAADYITSELDQLVQQVCDENGKPPVEVVAHEMLPAVAFIRWLKGAGPSVLAEQSRKLTWLPHRRCVVRRRPFGVVLVISPWNIPFLIPFTQVVAALAAGNAVVLKPSEVTPRCGDLVAEALGACFLPPGLLQVQHGDGVVGAELVAARPDRVVFTGSVATGRKVMAACAAHPIPVGLELGGIDALIVRQDADLEYASSAIAWGGTFNHGQVCASVERVIAHRSIYDELIDRVVDKMGRIDPTRDMGRVTFAGQRRVIDSHLADAEERGVTVCCGGHWVAEDKLMPTLLAGEALRGAAVWAEETFGPVVAALPFDDDDDAVALHNDTRFGLTASVFGRDMAAARALARRLNAGGISLNEIAAFQYSQPELPWGGVGESGFGRSHGEEGLLEMTWAQVIDENGLGPVEPKRPWWYPYGHDQRRAFEAFVAATAATSLGRRAVALADTAKQVARTLAGAPRH